MKLVELPDFNGIMDNVVVFVIRPENNNYRDINVDAANPSAYAVTQSTKTGDDL